MEYHAALFERSGSILEPRWIRARTCRDPEEAIEIAEDHKADHPEHFEGCEAIALDHDEEIIQMVCDRIIAKGIKI